MMLLKEVLITYRILTFYLLVILTTVPLTAQSQDVEFNRLGIEKGLFQISIYSIAQDKTGFIWIATQDGLLLYDGMRFIEFNHNSSEGKGISNNSISKILVDAQNNVWIGTWGGGLNLYNRKTQRFSIFKFDKNNPKSISHNRVQTLFQDKNGTLWVGTAGGGICKFNAADSSFTRYPYGSNKPNAISHARVWDITQSPDGLLWIATQNGINVLNPASGTIKTIFINESPQLTENANLIRTIWARKNGEVWAGTQNGIYVFSSAEKQPNHILLPFTDEQSYRARTINCLYELNNHTMLIGTYGAGLYNYNTVTGSFTSYFHKPEDRTSISGNDIRCITVDRSGLIWIGTRGGSINTTLLQPKRFTTYDNEEGKKIYLSDKNSRSAFFDSKGNLWVGTNEQGLHLFAKNGNGFKYIVRKELDEKIYSDRCWAIHESSDKTVWFACDDGLYFTKNSGNSIEKYQFPAQSPFPVRTESVRGLYSFKSQYLWFATSGNGFLQYTVASGTWKTFNTQAGFPSDDINYIMPETNNGILWLATGNGLVKYNFINGTFTIVGNEAGRPLKNNQAWALCLQQNIMWIGTSEGLVRYSLLENVMEKEPEGNDFSSKIISGIIVDDRGLLWISTSRGITRYNPADNSSKSYNIEDGLDWNSYNPGVFTEDTNGMVAFGGLHGLTVFNPDKIPVNTFKSPVIITGFDILTKTKAISLIPPGLPPENFSKFELTTGQDNFKISFVSCNYQYSRKNRYYFQLEGVDKDWRDAGTDNSVTYGNVGPGDYVFRVKAFNNDMVPMGEDAVILISIPPPFYATLWFRFGLIILVIAGIAASLYVRFNNMKKRQMLLEEEVRKRTAELLESEKSLRQANAAKDKFFSIIAHDLRAPFQALISYSNIINTEMESLTEQERKEISTQIELVSRSSYELLENLLKWSFTQTGKLVINETAVDVPQSVNSILAFNKQSAEMKSITLHARLDEALTLKADKDMFETVLRNIIGNAIKFTNTGGQVTVTTSSNNLMGYITITDTGVGMSQDRLANLFQLEKSQSTIGTNKEKGTGLGLILCKEFISLQNGTLDVHSKVGEGTTFTVGFPLYNVKA